MTRQDRTIYSSFLTGTQAVLERSVVGQTRKILVLAGNNYSLIILVTSLGKTSQPRLFVYSDIDIDETRCNKSMRAETRQEYISNTDGRTFFCAMHEAWS